MELNRGKRNRVKIIRNVRRVLAGILTTALCFYAVVFSVLAANEKIISSKTDSQNVYLYVKGVSNISGGTVQIGNSICSNVSVGGLDAFATPLQTVILVDNSYSIKKDNRSDIQEILDGVIENRLDGEEFRIGTFSDSVTWLCDYTTDYELVRDTLDGIEYLNQDTCFSDCLYEVIKDMSTASEPVYSRVIIASDGADDKAIGYTNSEVVTLLERCNIPVYTIGALGSNSALETMFSFSRASRADYYLLDGSVSNDDIIASLLEDYGLACIRITPDDALLDGGQKSIKVILQTGSGEVTITSTVDMPFASGSTAFQETPEILEETETTEASGTAGELPVLGNNTNVSLKTEDKENETSSGMLSVAIGITVVLAVIIGIVILAVVLKKKKMRQQISRNNGQQNNEITQKGEKDIAVSALLLSNSGIPKSNSDKTIMINSANVYNSDRTINLWDQIQPRQEARTFLVLRDIGRENVMFKVPIQDIVRIGRKDADIVVDYDRYISAEQCEIIKRGSLLYIKDSGSSNGTFYENMRIYDQEVPIVSGGIIQIGKSKFTVTMIME